MTLFADLTTLLSAHAVLAYLFLFAYSFAETLIGIGFFLYGEVVFIPAAILAGTGVLNIWLVSFALIAGGAVGDSTSFFLGRRWGASVFKEGNRVFNPANYHKGLDFFEKYGTKAVFFARLLGPASWITPFLAGTYNVSYPRFLAYNIAGVIVGIGQFLVVGYFFGTSYKAVLAVVQQNVALVVGAIVLLVLLYYIIQRNRR